ncbi:MAG: sensor histidine kinase [Planctomycetota bacterium]
MFERKSLKWPILVAIVMIVMLVGLTVGWVLLNISSAWDAGTTNSSAVYWVLLSVGAIFFAFLLAGVILYLIWIIQNVNLNRRQSNFIDAVTHELKTPIASLKLYLQTLHRRDVEGPQRQQFYGTMMEDVDRLDRLINQLLDVARLQRDQQDPSSKEWVSLRAITDECVERVAKQHALSSEVFQVIVEDSQVLAHRIDIDVLLGNLLDNAIKYSSANPQVEVRITFQNQSALIAISDNGPGIPRHLRRKVFSRFYRAGDELERRKPGVGLGLFLVRSIVERLKGSITVSERIHKSGATFLVTLPARQG